MHVEVNQENLATRWRAFPLNIFVKLTKEITLPELPLAVGIAHRYALGFFHMLVLDG